MAKSIAKKEKTEMTFSDERPDYIKDECRGQENVGMEDLTIPRLDVLQALSPQRKKNDPAYIEGAEEGILHNTVTSELYGKSVNFIPVYFRKEWLIWKAQDAGGGLEGVFDTESAAKDAFLENGFEGQTFKKNGMDFDMYEIVDTANHFGMVVKPDGSVEDIVISMSKSKMKVNRAFNTLIKIASGDRFSLAYKVEAVEDQNKQGQDYFNLKVTAKGFVSEDLYRRGEAMYEALSTTDRKVAHAESAKTETEEDEEY